MHTQILWRHANNMYITCAMRMATQVLTSGAAAAMASTKKPCLLKLQNMYISSAQDGALSSENVYMLCAKISPTHLDDIDELAAIFFQGDLMVTSSLDIVSRSSQINISFPVDSLL